MGRGGDQANISFLCPFGLVVSFDGEKSSVLTLRARIGLKRKSGKSRDFAKPLFEFLDQGFVSTGLVFRSEGVNVRKTGPRDRRHFGG